LDIANYRNRSLIDVTLFQFLLQRTTSVDDIDSILARSDLYDRSSETQTFFA